MIFEITTEEFEDLMVSTIEPTLVVLLLVAFTTFIISTYKKGELRIFALNLLIMAVAIYFAMLRIYLIEGILLITASATTVIAAIFLRFKTIKMEVKKDG